MAEADTTKDFYVYLHRYASGPKTGHVFYVGKGTGHRANSKKNRNRYWNNTANKYGYTVDIYSCGLQEWFAYELEFNLVSYFGRENLVNLTDGGEGPSSPSEETRKIMSEKARSRIRKPSGPMSQETKDKLSNSKIGKPNKLKGIPLSEETKKKLSESKKGKPNGHNGMKRSEQAKINMSIAQKNSKNKPDISGDKNPAKRKEVRERMSLVDRSYLLGDKNPMSNPDILKKFIGKNNPSATRVTCIETGITFDTIKSATYWLSEKIEKQVQNTSISQCCTGRNKTAYGFHWKYADK